MKHIQKTVKDFKFLYYQRHLCKGFFALPMPVVFPIKSEIGDGYVYIRQHIKALRIRDFDNEFLRDVSGGAPIGVKKIPVRGIAEGISTVLKLHGREETQSWVFTKGDLPRLINEETFTEFIACIPLKANDDPLVGKYTLISDYYERFIDIYRAVSGDVSVAHFENAASFTPFTGEVMLEIEDHVTDTIDEIVVEYYPKNFTHNMFQHDVHFTESGRVNSYFDDKTRAERIGHYLASDLKLNPFHKRMSDLLGVAEQTHDHTLLALTAFPVFETFYNEYLSEVRRRVTAFDEIISKKENKRDFIPIGTKLDWLPTAIQMLGFETASVGDYFKAIKEANLLRREVVDDGKQVNHSEVTKFIQSLTICANLCETSLGQAQIFASPLNKISEQNK